MAVFETATGYAETPDAGAKMTFPDPGGGGGWSSLDGWCRED